MYEVSGITLECFRNVRGDIVFTTESFSNALKLSRKRASDLFGVNMDGCVSLDAFDNFINILRSDCTKATEKKLSHIADRKICSEDFISLFESNEKFLKRHNLEQRVKNMKELHDHDFVTMKEWRDEAIERGYHHGLYGTVFEIEASLLDDIREDAENGNKKSVLYYSDLFARISACTDFSRGGFWDEKRRILEPIATFSRCCNSIHTGNYDREKEEYESAIVLDWNEEVVIGRNIFRVMPTRYGDDKMRFDWVENIPFRNIVEL